MRGGRSMWGRSSTGTHLGWGVGGWGVGGSAVGGAQGTPRHTNSCRASGHSAGGCGGWACCSWRRRKGQSSDIDTRARGAGAQSPGSSLPGPPAKSMRGHAQPRMQTPAALAGRRRPRKLADLLGNLARWAGWSRLPPPWGARQRGSSRHAWGTRSSASPNISRSPERVMWKRQKPLKWGTWSDEKASS